MLFIIILLSALSIIIIIHYNKKIIMCFSVSNKFEKYKVPPQVENSARTWDNAEIYKTTYFQNNAKNVYRIVYNS